MIKNIFFDLDDTLLDFHTAEREALAKTLRLMGLAPDEAVLRRYSEINLSQWKLLERGLTSREKLKTDRYRILFDEFGIDASPSEAAKHYEDYLCVGHYFVEGAPELLRELALRYDLYLVSNGTARVQHSRMGSAGIEKYFRGIFVSSEIGFDKPSRKFFDACFAKIKGFDRSESVIVGDSLSSDIAGGKNSGIATVWFNPRGETNASGIVPDFEIRRLSELPTLLLSMK